MLCACMYGRTVVAKWLYSQGASLHEADNDGEQILHVAARGGHLHVAQWAHAQGADLHASDHDGVQSLHVASGSGRLEVAHWLLACGASVDAATNFGRRPLHYAAHEGHIDVAELLVSRGAHLHFKATDLDGLLPLDLAKMERHTSMVNWLLEQQQQRVVPRAATEGKEDTPG